MEQTIVEVEVDVLSEFLIQQVDSAQRENVFFEKGLEISMALEDSVHDFDDQSLLLDEVGQLAHSEAEVDEEVGSLSVSDEVVSEELVLEYGLQILLHHSAHFFNELFGKHGLLLGDDVEQLREGIGLEFLLEDLVDEVVSLQKELFSFKGDVLLPVEGPFSPVHLDLLEYLLLFFSQGAILLLQSTHLAYSLTQIRTHFEAPLQFQQ